MTNSNSTPPTPHAEYEPTTRVCTVFFSAVIGFGLNHLLQQLPPVAIAADRWPCFILAFLLFLRFLFGSANHLWHELVRAQAPKPSSLFILWDIVCLITFGLIGVWICYSTTIPEFLCSNLIFGIAAALVALVNVVRGDPTRRFAVSWLVMNLVQVAVVAAQRSWDYPLIYLIAVYLLLLLVDAFVQLETLKRA
jgi:hypothetical protein